MEKVRKVEGGGITKSKLDPTAPILINSEVVYAFLQLYEEPCKMDSEAVDNALTDLEYTFMNPVFSKMPWGEKFDLFEEFHQEDIKAIIEECNKADTEYKPPPEIDISTIEDKKQKYTESGHNHCKGFYCICRGCSDGLAKECGIKGKCGIKVPCHRCFCEQATQRVYHQIVKRS